MRRILGIDYGRARVGLALSDPLGITAQPLSVVRNTSAESLIAQITDIVSEREVERIVVGLPLKLDGTQGDAAVEVAEFARKLSEHVGVPVELWDERLSTVQAERAMLQADLSRARRKKHRDKVAAQIFLQSYLDAHRHPTP